MSRHARHEEFDPTCGECVQESASKAFQGTAGRVEVPVEDQAVIDGAPPEVSRIANSIGYALAERGVRFTADDAIAAAYRVAEQSGPAVRVTESVDLGASEAHINGEMSFDDVRAAVETALRARLTGQSSDMYECWAYVTDLTATDAVYSTGGDLYQCSYEIDAAGTVTLGDPTEVVRTYTPAPAGEPEDELGGGGDVVAAEAGGKPKLKPGPQVGKPKATTAKKVVKEAEERDQLVGRILEAKGEDSDGGRIFGVRIIAYGDSKNRRRYPEAVMREAAPLYEGAKAYDHHRSDDELRSSTINGLIGSYRGVEATAEGLDADLHLLPGATHAAEALDATIAAQDEGLPPLIGLSHDVMARFRNVTEGGVQVQEATAITQVNSADLVADPAAGGKATRMVAGGQDGTGMEPAENEEGDVPATKDEILAAFAEASDDELAGVGLARAAEATTEVEETEEVDKRETEAAGQPKTSFLAGLMIREKVKAAGLPEKVAEGVTAALPERIVEADIDAQIAGIKHSLSLVEVGGLTPTVGTAQVTQEARDKKVKALDAFFAGNFQGGYRSFRQAWEDFTGHRPRAWDTDVNKLMLRESYGAYDSGDRLRVEEGEARLRESMDSTTWNLVLGDSITRRLIAEYSRPSLALWRQIVSSIVPLNDFRTQRIDRIGGYGTLPDVNQGAPYQDLTSPTNQEITYALGKKGGIESITFEMIANDDVRAISKIPTKLGLAAAQTLFRFIFDIFVSNAAVTYDGVTLFHASHANTGTSALSQSALSAVRVAMRQQSGYGDSKDILSIVPQTLIVPSALEELAWQLATSAVALPAGAPTGAASDTPNIHHRMSEPIVVDYYSDQNDWYTVADPAMVPTIEVGFYNGRQDPELFTQSDPSVGSVFDADKITYKIRHMYSAAVLDHRGVYRNTL